MLGFEVHLLFLGINGLLVTQIIHEKIRLMKHPYTTLVVCHPKKYFEPKLTFCFDIN